MDRELLSLAVRHAVLFPASTMPQSTPDLLAASVPSWVRLFVEHIVCELLRILQTMATSADKKPAESRIHKWPPLVAVARTQRGYIIIKTRANDFEGAVLGELK